MKTVTSSEKNSEVEKPVKRKHDIKVGLGLKVTILIIALIVCASSVSNYIIYNLSYKALKEEIKDKLIIIASNAVSRLDTDKLVTIKTEEDQSGKVYLELQKMLQEVKESSRNKVRYIYTVTKDGDSYKYVLDATPIGDEDHSTVGDDFSITDFPKAAEGFNVPTAEDEPTFDAEVGMYSQSGYVPIKDKKGNVIGILGVDMDVTTLKNEEANLRKAAIIALASCLLLALLFGIIFSRYLTKPIIILTKGTKRIAEGDLETVVDIKRKDEFGELAHSFNAMTQDIKTSHEALKKYSLELEDIVRKRTAAISNLLDNAGQGFMSFGNDLLIHDEYSLECKRIFDKEIAHRPFPELLFPDNEEERNTTEMVLNEYFKATEEVAKQSLIWLLPDEDVINDNNIQLSYNPIYDPIDHSEQLMVILTDITEKKQLENQMEQERKVLRMVVKVVTQVNDFFSVKKDFENFYQNKLFEILDSDLSVKDKIHQVFKDIHTFKGNFGIYVIHIIPRLHELESQLSRYLEQEDTISLEQFKDFMNQHDFKSWLDEDLDVLAEVLGEEFLTEHNEDILYIDRKKVLEFEKRIEPILGHEKDQELLNELKKWLDKPFSSLLKSYVDYVSKLADRNEILLYPVNIEGEELPVNPDAYNDFVKSLVHIFRNAIVHAIESPEERLENGKDEHGMIKCMIKSIDKNIVLTIADDGRGLDVEKIRTKVIQKGLSDEDTANKLSDEELIKYIFNDEFSTREEVSELAGRGVGLSAVKQEVEKLGGSVAVTTTQGKGTTFEFTIPVLY